MIFDILMGIFLFGALDSSPPTPVEADPGSAPLAPPAIEELVIGQLSCQQQPDPTQVLRAMMDAGLIHVRDREDFESFSCFGINWGMSLGGVTMNSVCGGVMDPAINAANPDLYPPNERIAAEDRYQVIAFGTNEDLGRLTDWYNTTFGPQAEAASGVTDGLYAPGYSNSEVFCDEVLAEEIMALYGMSGQSPVPEVPGTSSDIPAPPPAPIYIPPPAPPSLDPPSEDPPSVE